MNKNFLPASRREMIELGWDRPDVVLVTGDAYVDHPSFGVALIGRWLEAHGFKVAILAQPRHQNSEDFRQFGTPRLFFGITGGNLDSIVANYSANAKVRDQDAYSPGGNPYFGKDKSRRERRRPDRAVIRYAALAREACPGVPIVLGGLEASLRRFIHYDYQQNRLRASVLSDAKADLLVYGMGERAVLTVAERLTRGLPLTEIPGTCERLTEKDFLTRSAKEEPLVLPDWTEIEETPAVFMDAELVIDKQARAMTDTPICQKQQAMYIWQNRPAEPLSPDELDMLYSLPFQRAPHPAAGDVPAWRMVRDSVTIVRGCSGNCSFCAITRHQGAIVTSRSTESVVREVTEIAGTGNFRGTISDLGGPTANLYGTFCRVKECSRRDCFFPKLCNNLGIDEERFLALLDNCEKVPGVKHLHVSSGLRMELLLKTPKLLKRLIERHLPGAMKIAPEHTEDEVLRLMHKPGGSLLLEFLDLCRKLAGPQPLRFVPYFIASHPGCTERQMGIMAEKIRKMGLAVRQFQDFTPTPGTIATAMYVTGLDREGNKINVAKGITARRNQREVLEKITIKPNSGKERRKGIKKPAGRASGRRN